jgi:hypothetical protein
VADIDMLVAEPSLMILPRLNLVRKTPVVIVMTVAILASPVITILAPSLHTRQASGVFRTLTVPTLNTTTNAVQNDLYIDSYVVFYHPINIPPADRNSTQSRRWLRYHHGKL